MSSIHKSAMLVIPFALVACAALAGEATPPAEAPAPETSIRYKETFAAPSGTLTSVADLRAFGEEFSRARFDTSRAAKVEGMVIQRESCEWKLDGFVFLRDATRGIRTRAIFFGKGTYRLTPPIDMERQQVRRFLGTDTVDVPIKQCVFTFYSAEDQQVFEALTLTPEIAAQAKAENEDAKNWADEVDKYWSRPQEADEVARRQYGDFYAAALAYERILEPGKKGSLEGAMQIDVPEAVDTSASHLVALSYEYSPDDLVEVGLAGQFDHGDKKYWSQICNFNEASQYAGGGRGGSSPYLEKERKDDLQIAYDRLRMTFDPGAKSDIRMRSDMDLVVGTDKLMYLAFGITPYMSCTKATFEGQPVEFFQPSVPGYDKYHAPFIIAALPHPVKRGDTLKVSLELEGKILYRVDAATWMVKEEDRWFPNPSGQLGGVAARFETTLNVPKGYTGIANGRPGDCAPEDVEPGMDCFHFKTNTGIDFGTFNIGSNMRIDKGESMKDEDADRDGRPDPTIPIRVYTNASAKREFEFVDPDNPVLVEKRSYSLSENGPDIVGRAQIAHKVYTEWFGPCPYDTLMITPHPKGHGRGSASLLLIAQSAFLSSTAFAEFASLSRRPNNSWSMTQFLVHEIAHQWWGGAARIRGDLDQWFSEGFADYSAALVLEELDKVNESDWFWSQMSQFREYLLRDDGYVNNLVPLCAGNRVQSQENRSGYEYYRQNFMYSKGAYVMHMLRILARAKAQDPAKGDALFKQGWHDFLKVCETKAPSNNDMETSLAKTYGMPMGWFFDQWIYGTGVPRVDWSYKTESRADGWFVTCHVKQKDTNFQFPLAVSFYQGKQEAGFSHQWVGKAETDLELGPLPFEPTRIDVNKDMGVLGIFKEVPYQAPAAAAGQ